MIAGSLGEVGWPRSPSTWQGSVCDTVNITVTRSYYYLCYYDRNESALSFYFALILASKASLLIPLPHKCYCIFIAPIHARLRPSESKYFEEICIYCRTPSPDRRGRWVPATGQRNKWPSQGPQSKPPARYPYEPTVPQPSPVPPSPPPPSPLSHASPEPIVPRRRKFGDGDSGLWRCDWVLLIFFPFLVPCYMRQRACVVLERRSDFITWSTSWT